MIDKQRMKYLLVFLLLFTPAAKALELSDFSLDIYGRSIHHNTEKEFNENNIGVGIRLNLYENNLGLSFAHAGVFQDSQLFWAKFAGLAYQFKLWRFRLGGALNVVKSRGYNSGSPIIVPIPIISLDLDHVIINFSHLPDLGGEQRTGAVSAFYITVPFS